MSDTQTTPAGWYNDGSGNQRWWDGQQWGVYAPQPVAAAPATVPAQKWSGISISGFALSVVGVLAALTLSLAGLGFMAGLFGVIFSIAGMATDSRRNRRGRGLATAGLIISVPALIFSLFVIFALNS